MEGSSIANEIYAQLNFTWDFKLAAPLIVLKPAFRADSLARYNIGVQSVGTGWEALEIGDLVKQYIVIKNLNTTNYVSFGKTVADAFEIIRIMPEAFVFFYLIAAAPAVKANVASCDIEIYGVEGSG